MNDKSLLKYTAFIFFFFSFCHSGIVYGSFLWEEKEGNIDYIHDSSQGRMTKRKVQAAFHYYLKTKRKGDPIDLVVGCGQNHKPLTVAGNPHNHAGAFTIDRGKANSICHEISNPHVQGDVFSDAFFPSLPDNTFDTVTFEHLNACMLSNVRERRLLLSQTLRILKPGGKFIFLSGGIEHHFLTEKRAASHLRNYGFSVSESFFMKKLPSDKDLKGFDSLSDEEQFSLVWESLNKPDPTLWRVLTPKDQLRFADTIYQDYAYLRLVGIKPLPVHHDKIGVSFGSDDETEKTFLLDNSERSESSEGEFEGIFEMSDDDLFFNE